MAEGERERLIDPLSPQISVIIADLIATLQAHRGVGLGIYFTYTIIKHNVRVIDEN